MKYRPEDDPFVSGETVMGDLAPIIGILLAISLIIVFGIIF